MFPNSITVKDKVYLPEVSVQKQYYRVNHDNPLWRYNVPEVFRLFPFHHVVLTENLQWLWRRMNIELTDDQWTQLSGNTLGFTNSTGFPGHHNYIKNQEVNKDNPRFDQARVCGGAILTGYERDGNLFIDTIDTRYTLPSVEYVLSQPHLYYEAINIALSSTGVPVIRKLKSAWGKKVLMPLVSNTTVWLPLSTLEKLPLGSPLPGPYQYP